MKFSFLFIVSIIACLVWVLFFVYVYDHDSSGSSLSQESSSKLISNSVKRIEDQSRPLVKASLLTTTTVKDETHSKVKFVDSVKYEDKERKAISEIIVEDRIVDTKIPKTLTADVKESNKAQIKNKESYRVGHKSGISWDKFLKFQREISPQTLQIKVSQSLHLNVCSKDLVGNVTAPGLSKENYDWCKWALSDTGGRVKVGKSYGSLNGRDQQRYEQLNCNNVAQGKNPSCDDAWGDGQIASWKRNVVPDLCGDPSKYSSKVNCMDSSSLARFCVFEHAVLDFSLMKRVSRPGRSTGSRSWGPGFLSTHCASERKDINFYEFYRPSVSPDTTRCNFVFNETVLAYSHDNIKNLGHSMSDFMNVWAMLWLSGTSQQARDISFLNIDALRMGHSYDDELNQFARHYELQFARVLKASDFAEANGGTVCFKRLIFMPRPVVLFTWDGWFQDMRCSFVGPSSLFQRWNLAIRHNYGLLANAEQVPTNERIQVLLIVRSISKYSDGQSGRVFSNKNEIVNSLSSIPGIELVVRDLASMPFEEQVRLIASASLVVGMHGAGIASSMHMAVGSKHCCGVVEIFPQGEYRPIRGYGNMARRMGHHYERLELSNENSRSNGGEVPPEQVKALVVNMLSKIEARPSCLLPSVLDDPHFSSVPGVWDS